MPHGDFGTSYTYRVPVSELINARLGVSVPLAIISLALTVIIAFPAGIVAAARRNSKTDVAVMGITQLGVAIPNFWFAMLLVIVFAVILHWFSAGGFPGWNNPWLALRARRCRRSPRSAAGLHPRPRHALGAARYTVRRLHPLRSCQGPEPPADALAACAAQQQYV